MTQTRTINKHGIAAINNAVTGLDLTQYQIDGIACRLQLAFGNHCDYIIVNRDGSEPTGGTLEFQRGIIIMCEAYMFGPAYDYGYTAHLGAGETIIQLVSDVATARAYARSYTKCTGKSAKVIRMLDNGRYEIIATAR